MPTRWRWALLCVFAIGLAQAETYRWQDAAGNVSYGDDPPDDALSLTRVETHECTNEACREERRRRFEDLQASNRALEEWLDSRAREQAPAEPAEHRETHTVFLRHWFPPASILAPDGHSLCSGTGCLRLHRSQAGGHRRGLRGHRHGPTRIAPMARSHSFPRTK